MAMSGPRRLPEMAIFGPGRTPKMAMSGLCGLPEMAISGVEGGLPVDDASGDRPASATLPGCPVI